MKLTSSQQIKINTSNFLFYKFPLHFRFVSWAWIQWSDNSKPNFSSVQWLVLDTMVASTTQWTWTICSEWAIIL